jgi:hypothetical protein
MVGLKELIFFGKCLIKCMAQTIVRNHHQVLWRIYHHHLHFLIRVKKGNQVLKKEEAKSASLGKPDCPVSQTGLSGFGRIESSLAEEDDCSTSSSDDDNNIYDEYDEQELLMEFKKLISKNIKLQKRHRDLICSHKELMNSYALLESTHEVMVTTVKDSQPHTCTCAQPSIDLSCANSYCSKVKSSCDEHVLIGTCDSLLKVKMTSSREKMKC